MKNILQLLLLVVIMSQDLVGQFQVCNSSTNNNLHDVWFINQNIGIAVGDSGTIVKSIDGGLNWNLVMINDTVIFRKVKFFDNQNGIAVGSDIYITNDAGQTWQLKNAGINNSIDVEIINDSTAIISGYPNRLIKTSNRGETWEVIIGDKPMLDIVLISYLDENIAYSTCGGGGKDIKVTLKTIDGGNTWTEIIAQSGIEYTILETVSFVSEELGFRGGWYNPHLMRTIDGGINWESVNFDSTPKWEQSLYDFHVDKNHPNAYYACGWYGNIYKSEDGGANWKELESGISGTTSLYGIFFIDDSTGWAVGDDGTILKTSNGGGTAGFVNGNTTPKIELFPNPANSLVYIENSEKYKVKKILLTDNTGRIVLSKESGNTVDMTDLSCGIYYLIIKTDEGTHIEKIIKI